MVQTTFIVNAANRQSEMTTKIRRTIIRLMLKS